jgi:hypothetical protein
MAARFPGMCLQLRAQFQSDYPFASAITLQTARTSYGLLPNGQTLSKDRSV